MIKCVHNHYLYIKVFISGGFQFGTLFAESDNGYNFSRKH